MLVNKKMKVLFLLITLFLVLFLTACATAPALNQSIDNMESDLDTQSIYAGSCAQGNSACDYPGSCGQYIDQDGDGLCDR